MVGKEVTAPRESKIKDQEERYRRRKSQYVHSEDENAQILIDLAGSLESDLTPVRTTEAK